jgi:hypothetical protein
LAGHKSPAFFFTFELEGKSYAALTGGADLAAPGARVVSSEGHPVAVIAPARATLPVWTDDVANQGLLVEGGCHATLGDFAVVSREVMDIDGDAPVSGKDLDSWLGETNSQLVAELHGCRGGNWAQLPVQPVAAAVPVTDKELAAKVRKMFFVSDTARAAEQMWREEAPGTNWRDSLKLDIQIFEEPENKERWISVSAQAGEGCGGPWLSEWRLYRVDGNRLRFERAEANAVTVKGAVTSREEYGGLDWIVTDIFGDRVLRTAGGVELARDHDGFHGCGC